MMPLPLDVKAEMQVREQALRSEHQDYLLVHPEVELLLQDFISAALVEQPVDVFAFARDFFATADAPAPAQDDPLQTGEVIETASQRVQDNSQANSQADADDMADLDDMAADTNVELLQYLKAVFEAIDTDSSGTLSRSELKAKLDADDELPRILGFVGGETWSILTQLDGDGDDEITWLEFEQMVTGGL